jgi:type IX secretion system PorP/SprF family membrane protein
VTIIRHSIIYIVFAIIKHFFISFHHFIKQLVTYLFIFSLCLHKAQQTTIYTQSTFNKAGINPAASGTDINQKIYYTFGVARPVIAFNNGPKQNFANLSFTIRPPRSYHYWQNIGFYVEADQSGIITNQSIYGSYTFHLLVNSNLVASFGVFAGARKFLINTALLDANDPIVQKTNFKANAYPDIIPGFRLSNKKFFFEISAKQITAIQQKDIISKNAKQIGGPSYLFANLFFSYGKFIPINNDFVLLPSIILNSPLIAVPNVDANMMLFYNNLFGAGISLRNTNFLSVIFQLKILKNLALGVAYSKTVNKLYTVAPNGFEIMVGVTPMGLNTKFTGHKSIARCPVLEF